ncbi:hypothetical protein NCU16616 [Neurospora crassa OR74A]|uniref:Uncharacterized protein n=1 Tax=Neurospora crassa (strain ATCC 24698 / 74-OR23-1A / CBS 708.71 / DSM 1257 / FGSC 987) TaxID=367110 RepID=U9W2N1_NEUCR|nr:hypothetical protein NCU16616 [Neurospora crassa OR74A]ESA43131.1 hypothetical protein NCU16616 [Neurospora crassa OR74A]|eukprot:XP_011394016.1 hypothetical protein NCU16616 [Neurospora crassa OR74A]
MDAHTTLFTHEFKTLLMSSNVDRLAHALSKLNRPTETETEIDSESRIRSPNTTDTSSPPGWDRQCNHSWCSSQGSVEVKRVVDLKRKRKTSKPKARKAN